MKSLVLIFLTMLTCSSVFGSSIEEGEAQECDGIFLISNNKNNMKKHLLDLQNQLSRKMKSQKSILELMKVEKRDFVDGEKGEFESLDLEIRELMIKIEDQKRKVTADKRAANLQAPKSPGGSGLGIEGMHDPNFDGILGRSMAALKTGRAVTDDSGQEIRGINSTTGSSLIQDPVIQGRIIYDLMSNNPLVKAGAQYFNATNHSQFPKVTAYPAVQWMGQGDELQATEPTIEAVKFDLKDVAVVVRVDNNVLYDATSNAGDVIQETIRRSINQSVLEAVFSGSTANKQPIGFDNMTGVQVLSIASAPMTNFNALVNGAKVLLDKNVLFENISMVMSPKVWASMASLQATDGQPLGRPFDFAKMQGESKLHVTTAIKDNFGGSGDESRFYMGDFSQLAIGIGGPFALTLSEKYSTHLQTGFLLHLRVDVQAYRADNFVIIKDVVA